MPLLFDHPQSPPGGYSFPDPSGVLLKADNLRGLLGRIASFRATNGFAPGNPAVELETYCKANHPWLVTKVGINPVGYEDPVARWINRMWTTPPKEREFSDAEIVRVRLDTCAACPHYSSFHPFSLNSRRRLEILGVGHIKDHGACKVHHWAVGLAALVNAPEVKIPVEGCWAQG